MTSYMQRLLDEAKDMWERGYNIPVDLYSRMASAGFDVPALEETYKKGSSL